ncbi:MAG: DUF169 domain-containing protein [Gammaproteobacteria bacterium]
MNTATDKALTQRSTPLLPAALDIAGICGVLAGKIRGNPVAISLFKEQIPPDYTGIKVDPCQILRHAMDDGKIVYFDRSHQDCLHGAFITGVHEGTEQIRSGRLLTDYLPAYEPDAAHQFNSGRYILPQGAITGAGAAPLDKVPLTIPIDSIVVVCTPFWAGQIAAVRSVEDGVQPSAAAGSSFCSDMFATPWYEENVVLTPGDMGGRMNNKLKPEEMFVVIPARWANNLVKLLSGPLDVKGIYEATRPPDSIYWVRKAKKQERAAGLQEQLPSSPDSSAQLARDKYGLVISMPWEEEAMATIAKAPKFVRKFAVGNVEDYAEEKSYPVVTAAVVREQADSVGMGKWLAMLKKS